MKRVLLFIVAISFSVQSLADDKLVTQNYNRNSISVVAVKRSGHAYMGKWLTSYDFGEKFDVNVIQSNMIDTPGTTVFGNAPGEKMPDEFYHSYVAALPLGREIISFIFNRQEDGTMDDKLIRSRGFYNAIDQDILNAKSTSMGLELVAESGYELLKSCYILVVDCRGGFVLKNSVSAYTKGLVYKLDISEDELADLLTKTWIYPEDSPSVRDQKKKIFDNYLFKIKFICSDEGFGSDDGKYEGTAAKRSVGGVTAKLENKILEWQAATVISGTKPLRAKIGKKENLRVNDLYRTYSYKEDADGNVVSVKQGYIRATNIADNTGVATGHTTPSEFFQISGFRDIEEGWTIKQVNDHRIGLGVSMNYDPDGRLMPRLDYDGLIKINTNGSVHHFLASLSPDQLVFREKVGAMKFCLGYGWGYYFIRSLEIMPYIMAGVSTLMVGTSENLGASYYAEPGVRLTVNATYPVQFYGSAYYFYHIPIGNEEYMTSNKALAEYGRQYSDGLGFTFGVKYNF